MGQVRKLWIPGPAGRLEAALRIDGDPRAAVVIAHPHPLHGGTMHNPVIFHSDRALHRAGLATLRFNFRGVGTSEGEHDSGRGEVEDLAAAASWLGGTANGAPLLLVGFSFGAVCSLRHALDDVSVRGLIAIGLPTRLYDFDELPLLGRPLAVVQGSEDELGSPDEVRSVIERADPPGKLYVVEGMTHLFPGRAADAASRVTQAAECILEGL